LAAAARLAALAARPGNGDPEMRLEGGWLALSGARRKGAGGRSSRAGGCAARRSARSRATRFRRRKAAARIPVAAHPGLAAVVLAQRTSGLPAAVRPRV